MARESFGGGGRCPRCGKGPMVTDNTTGEMFCGGCGFVLTERVEESGPEWRSFSKEEHEDRSRTGTPTSLAMHDMGLATIIGPADKDASGKLLSASMKSTIERLRTWDSRSQVHEPVDRNFRQAFSELDRLKDKLKGGTFMLTYGDGVSNIDIKKLVSFHKDHGKLATVTAVRPAARFGGINFEDNRVTEFKEKPQTGEGWINGGFFIFEPEVFDYLHGDNTVLEGDSLENIAKDGELMAFKHEGFWQCMDALRDKHLLENLWASGSAPWKVWKD